MRSAEVEGPDSPWRPVISWAIGWAHYVLGDLDEAEVWLRECAELGPRTEQWIVCVAAIADLSLIAGRRGDRDEQMRIAREAVDLARSCGLLDSIEDGEVHTAHGVALIADGRAAGGAAGARARRVPAPALGPAARPLRQAHRARHRASRSSGTPSGRARCSTRRRRCSPAARDAGALPARLAEARRATRLARPAEPGAALSERERTVLRLLGSGLTEREIGRELYLSFNTVHSHVKAIYRKLGVSSRADAVGGERFHLGEFTPRGVTRHLRRRRV